MTESAKQLAPRLSKRLFAYSAIAGAAVVGASPTHALAASKSAAQERK